MPENESENSWKRLVGAARDAGATEDDTPPEEAPSGFVKSVIAMREGLWKFAKTILWRRWSLLAALLAIALYCTFYFIMKSNPPTPSVPAPPVPVPAPAPTLPLPPEP